MAAKFASGHFAALAAVGDGNPAADEGQTELYVGGLPPSTKATDVVNALQADSGFPLQVLECKIKTNARNGKTYGFVRVQDAAVMRRIIDVNNVGLGIRIKGRKLFISPSNNAVHVQLTTPEQIVSASLPSFAMGVYMQDRNTYFKRWSSAERHGSVRITVNMDVGYLSLCFAGQDYQYMLKFSMLDLDSFVVVEHGTHCSACRRGLPPNRHRSDSLNLVLRFSLAAEVYRMARMDAAGVAADSREYTFDESQSSQWERTLDTFTANGDVLGQYFHVLVTSGAATHHLERVASELRCKYPDYEQVQPVVDVVDALPPPTLSRGDYDALAARYGHRFRELFAVEVLVTRGLIYREMLSAEFFAALDDDSAYRALLHYAESYKVMEYPSRDLRAGKELVARNQDAGRALAAREETFGADSQQVLVYRLNLTPLTTYAVGPEIDTPNRVLRRYGPGAGIRRFLRVHFVDENQRRLNVGRAENPLEEVLEDVRHKLCDGVNLCGRRYRFLAMSNSQLREHACWLYAAECGHREASADVVRRWMGSFDDIRNVAKYAARMGQCFSCTATSGKLTVARHEFDIIDDVTAGPYNFSDGIGMISPEFAQEAIASLQLKGVSQASAFQIRFAGFKGVVAVHPGVVAPLKLRLRPSMHKFESEHLQLEVIQPARWFPAHLNREIILLLSTLGVRDDVFITLQKAMVDGLNEIVVNRAAAMKEIVSRHTLDREFAATTVIHAMMEVGAEPRDEPYLMRMLLAYRQNRLLGLEEKAHICVEHAALLMGVLDESKTLQYGQVVMQRWHNGAVTPITGRVVLAKNPCLHPGDIRVLEAVPPPPDNAYLRSRVNCLVFPARGERPHPDECSGSDLDGDQYFVAWEPRLLPPRTHAPASYPPRSKPRDARVSIADVCQFFTDYMQNDVLGAICVSHQAFADQLPHGALDERCLELAEMQSRAVDYPKTGVPVKISPRRHIAKVKPDFLKKPGPRYKSSKVLGKLFRDISEYRPPHARLPSVTCDRALLVDGHEKFLPAGRRLRDEYNEELVAIMRRYGIVREEEAVGGYMVKVASRHHRKQRLHDAQAQVCLETLRLRQHYYEQEFAGMDSLVRRRKASAWYKAAYTGPLVAVSGISRRPVELSMISFGWIPFRELCSIKKGPQAGASLSFQ